MAPPQTFPPVLGRAILAWYAVGARRLSFRATTDPYAILVSEAMAQQTQAERVGETWPAFMARFPTVEALADAPLADVLRAWQGLGYNRRARNLWRAAARIVGEFGGSVPSDLSKLRSLPGVGPYTARAVAALAFGLPVGAVDTNVRRVLGRIVAGESGSLPEAELQRLADVVVPPSHAAAWTHALMDLGATVCHPTRPDCDACPARPWCRYPGEEAVAARATMPPTETQAVAVHTRDRRAPFPTTTRWLRGRIVDRLRGVDNGTWVSLDGPIGTHGREAVEAAVRALAHEGLVELDARRAGRLRARLPID